MLKRARIRNFRSCYDTEIEPVNSICAISGRNGVGKSNTLKAIKWACSTAAQIGADRPIAPEGPEPSVADASIDFTIELDNLLYKYSFEKPGLLRFFGHPDFGGPPRGLLESLDVDEPSGAPRQLLHRVGDRIVFDGRSEPIRVKQMTPAVAALNAILPSDDPFQSHLQRIMAFFRGVHYYSLDDEPDAKDEITDREYLEWKFRHESEGEPADSVPMRLINLWKEDADRFHELASLLGADGVNVVESIEIFQGRVLAPSSRPDGRGQPTSEGFTPVFRPSTLMGGAPGVYPFSALSVGTRRVIRIVTSMLFDKRSLMLLEHPEDSIHPGLLRKLIDLMRSYSGDTQMLFTTHSPEVLDILKPEEILLATAPGGSTKIRRLTGPEIDRARLFLRDDGSMSDFLESEGDL